MNLLNKVLAGLLLVGLAHSSVVNAEDSTVVTPSQDVRTISLAENADGGGSHCTFSASQDKTVWLNHNDEGCRNDQMSYIKLDNVRSAVTIQLESRDCNDSGGWVFVLKTYIDPISTPWISIVDLKGQPHGAIITRGVRKTDGWNEDQDNVKGKLSCLRLAVSPLP